MQGETRSELNVGRNHCVQAYLKHSAYNRPEQLAEKHKEGFCIEVSQQEEAFKSSHSENPTKLSRLPSVVPPRVRFR